MKHELICIWKQAVQMCRLFLISWGGVRLSPFGTSAATGLLYQPWMIDDDCGAVGGIRICRGNLSTGRKIAQVPLSPPQIPHDLSWARTLAAEVGSWRLTSWAMERPCKCVSCNPPVPSCDDILVEYIPIYVYFYMFILAVMWNRSFKTLNSSRPIVPHP
jgi:hypothetical protein